VRGETGNSVIYEINDNVFQYPLTDRAG